MIDLHKATAGDGLMLVYGRQPRNVPLTSGLIITGAVVAFFGFLRIFPDGGLVLAILAVALAAGGVGIAYMPHVTRVVTDFDKLARQIKVTTTRSDGHEESMSAGFDQVRTLQLYQHRGKGAQTQTLTLILRDGRTAFLGQERQRSDWFQAPFHDGLADTVKRIRDETGVGGAEELPLAVQVAGRIIGVARK